MKRYAATAIAAPNIAIIKYWGKRNEKLKLPMNDSISITLDRTFNSRTTVEFSSSISKDTLRIDGKSASAKEMGNAMLVLNFLRKKAGTGMKASIVSENNFPKAAGLASSASGYAALAAAAAEALGLKIPERELSVASRLGSGSACRSVIGGFAWWRKGKRKDGADSYASQIADENYWKDFRVVTVIVSGRKKPIGSTEGMKRTVKTSRLYSKRLKMLERIVPMVRKAVIERDFEKLMQLAMAESDSLHAVMRDSSPPIVYLNDASRSIIEAVRKLNSDKGKIVAGYSFDAGPNAHIFTLKQHVPKVMAAIKGMQGVKRVIVRKAGKGSEVKPGLSDILQ